MDVRLLLDSPGEPKSRIQVASLGEFNHSKYGEFTITSDDIKSWQDNLKHLPGGRALIDLDHRSDRAPRNSEAAGWITGVTVEDGVPMADVEWTPVGRQAITDKRYLFFSPSYGSHANEKGEKFDNVLTGGALTNKPFLSSMKTVSLAAPERMVEAYEAIYDHTELDVGADERKLAVKENNALPDGSYPIRNTAQLHAAIILARSGHGNVAAAKTLIQRRAKELGANDLLSSEWPEAASGKTTDSRAKKMDKALLTLLDLDDDADDSTVLTAVTAIKEKATTEPKTLDQLAGEAKKVLLDSAEYTQLRSDATAGREAADELHAAKFESAWHKALETGRAVAGMEESKRALYQVAPDLVIKELDEGPVLVSTKPSGWDNTKLKTPEAPAGVDPDNYNLDQRIWAYMTEKGLASADYPKVLDQAIKGQIRLGGDS